MDLPTYTKIWRIEKRLYKLYDFRLPVSLSLIHIGVFVGVLVPWVVLLQVAGVPFAPPWHVVYIVPPLFTPWLATRPVIENKKLTEVLLSQARYLAEPRTWCRLAPAREPAEIVVVARVWHRSLPVRSVASSRVGASLRRRGEGKRETPATALGKRAAGRSSGVPAEAEGAAEGTRVRQRVQHAPPTAGAGSPVPPSGGDAGAARPRRTPGPAPGGPQWPDVPLGEWPTSRSASHPGVDRASAPPERARPLRRRPARPARDVAPSRLGQPPPARPEPQREPGVAPAAPRGSASEATRDAARGDAEREEAASPGTASRAGPPVDTPGGDRSVDPAPRPEAPGDVPANSASASGVAPSVDASGPSAASAEAGRSSGSSGASAEAGRSSGSSGASAEAGRSSGSSDAENNRLRKPEDLPDRSGSTRRSTRQPRSNPTTFPPTEGDPAVGGGRPTGPAAEAGQPAVRPGSAPEEAAPEDPGSTDSGRAKRARTGESVEGGPLPGSAVEPTPLGPVPSSPEPPPVEPPLPSEPVPPEPPEPSSAASEPPVPSEPAASEPEQESPPPEAAGPVSPESAPPQPPRDAGPGAREAAQGPDREPREPVPPESTGAPAAAEPPRRPEPPPPLPPSNGASPGDASRIDPGHRKLRRLTRALPGRRTSADGEVARQAVASINAPFTGARRVVVLGCTGGAGQTVTALMLGHTLALHRPDRCVAVDLNPGFGSLARRSRTETPETLTSLLARAESVRGYMAMRAYTSQSPSRLEVLACDDDTTLLQTLSDQDYATALSILDRHYKVAVVDPAAAVVARLLPFADQLVLAAPASADAPEAVAMTFDWLDDHHYRDLRRGAVTVVNGVSRRSLGDAQRTERVAERGCRRVVRVPWDDHLGTDNGRPTEPEPLRLPARDAYLGFGGAVAEGFAPVPPRYHQEATSE